jgi:hypothetical protein
MLVMMLLMKMVNEDDVDDGKDDDVKMITIMM